MNYIRYLAVVALIAFMEVCFGTGAIGQQLSRTEYVNKVDDLDTNLAEILNTIRGQIEKQRPGDSTKPLLVEIQVESSDSYVMMITLVTGLSTYIYRDSFPINGIANLEGAGTVFFEGELLPEVITRGQTEAYYIEETLDGLLHHFPKWWIRYSNSNFFVLYDPYK